jgi:transposase-like protein
VIGDNIPNENHEGNCPKCQGDLEWDSGSDMESEKWYCLGCNSDFEVKVEMVRFWDTLKEIKQ